MIRIKADCLCKAVCFFDVRRGTAHDVPFLNVLQYRKGHESKGGFPMKKIFGWFLALLLILGAGTVSMAADEQVMNRKLGYFDNTRTVLFLPALFGDGDYAASYVNREMNTIFRYPYYRKLDTEGYTGKAYSPSELPALAEQTGADIVVMPVISRWQQIIMHPMLFSDGDAFIETAARIDIYSYKKADGIVRDDKASYWKTEDESFVRNVYILDEMMRIFTKHSRTTAFRPIFLPTYPVIQHRTALRRHQ